MEKLEKITEHLKFLGFEEDLELRKLGKGIATYLGRDSSYGVLIKRLSPDVYSLTASLSTSRKIDGELLNFVNKINQNSSILKVCAVNDEDNKTTISLTFNYIGEYDKKIFGEIFGIFEFELNEISNLTGFDKIFV